ncbi:MAG: bifunctional hydroxymethylpyrimidine kinase/phosphomethylpyrimidine kinase [Bacteroidia bacterium]|nr:bifunctional hydroxymethylpyrimidine kinase/phosphomethylpyrimidine kinase [Bacteroidia bacterium]
MARDRAVVMTIAGSDSGGGAGIQADLKTFAAFGVYGTSVITALTAQNTQGVLGIHPVPAAFVGQQYQALVADFDIRAIKVGMLGTQALVETVAELLREVTCPRIVDPVLVSTSGHRLLEPAAENALKTQLLPLATLITPNTDELACLTGLPVASEADLLAATSAAVALAPQAAWLFKGGHLASPTTVTDYLYHQGNLTPFQGPRVATTATHGTGCTLAAALTAQLAVGVPLAHAVEQAKAYLVAALEAAPANVGTGQGPLWHFPSSTPPLP